VDDRTLADLMPAIAQNIDGAGDFEQILPPTPDTAHGGLFSVRYGDALVVMIIQRPAKLVITAGVAVDVAWSDALLAHVNELNGEKLMVGRLFAKEYEAEGRGTGIVPMQEILECQDIDFGPSVNVILRVCGRVMGMAGRVAPELCQRHNGRPPGPDGWFQISHHAL
jgi:hypothetical protein